MRRGRKVKFGVLLAASLLFVAAMGLTMTHQTVAQTTTEGPTMFPVPPDALSVGDEVFDRIQRDQGIYFQPPGEEQPYITKEQAIEAARTQKPSLFQKTTSVRAIFVLYTNEARGVKQRPAWLVILDGVSVPPRGARGEAPQLPPHVQTQIVLDGATGDIITLMSMGHR